MTSAPWLGQMGFDNALVSVTTLMGVMTLDECGVLSVSVSPCFLLPLPLSSVFTVSLAR
jgi:hypothetical protein